MKAFLKYALFLSLAALLCFFLIACADDSTPAGTGSADDVTNDGYGSGGDTGAADAAILFFGAAEEAGGYAVTGYMEGIGPSLVIPATYQGIEVTEIASGAFADCTALKTVVVPDTIKIIGGGAFSGCTALESITIPFVGRSAGEENSGGERLFGYIFGTTAFEGGTSTSQFFDESDEGSRVDYCIPASLASVTVTGGSLATGAFSNCRMLTSATLGEAVTGVGNGAFYNCTGLLEVTVGRGVTDIAAFAFAGCSKLALVNLAEGLSTIGESAFQNCTGLTGLSVPNSVVALGKNMFEGCTALGGISLPFVGLSREKTEGNESVFGVLFDSKSLVGFVRAVQRYGVTSSTTGQIAYYIPATLRLVKITGGTLNVGAFSGCNVLTDVVLENVTGEVSFYAFENCTNLKNVTLPATVKGRVAANSFYGCQSLEAITLPQGINTVGSESFLGCTSLKSIVIPDAVTYIGNRAFKNCTALTEATLGTGVGDIYEAAFEGCTSLKTVNIPAATTFIGRKAFQGCSSLTEVVFRKKTGWKLETEAAVNVSSSYTNAANLRGGEYSEYFWKMTY